MLKERRCSCLRGAWCGRKYLRTLAEAYRIIMGRRNDALFVRAGTVRSAKSSPLSCPGAGSWDNWGDRRSQPHTLRAICCIPFNQRRRSGRDAEAMASGIPAGCVHARGELWIREVGGHRLLTEPRDGADLAEKIGFMIDRPKSERRWEKPQCRLPRNSRGSGYSTASLRGTSTWHPPPQPEEKGRRNGFIHEATSRTST